MIYIIIVQFVKNKKIIIKLRKEMIDKLSLNTQKIIRMRINKSI